MLEFDITSSKSRPFKIALQVTYWSVIVILIGLGTRFLEEKEWSYFVKWLILALPFKLAIFYGYFYYLIPKWLGKRTLLFVLVTIGLFAFYPPLKIYLDAAFGVESFEVVSVQIDEEEQELISKGQASAFQEYSRRAITVLLNIMTAFFFRFTIDWFKNIRIRRQMEMQQLKSELALLRNQVNPHFLFNTLNNIDAMVYKVSEEASQAIMKLSSIMRYMLYESNVDWVPLHKELDYLESYFELQKMRINKKKNGVIFNYDVTDLNMLIAPMIFIPFVENAFKHADFSDNLFIHCSLNQHQDYLDFTVQNSVPEAPLEKDDTGGIGLQNVKRRLELIYPKKNELRITEEGTEYKVSLKIMIDED